MKNIFILMVSLIIVSCVSVTKDGKTTNYNPFSSSSSGSYGDPLTVSELNDLVNNNVVHNQFQSFFFLPENKMIYASRGEKKKSMYFIRTSNVSHNNNAEHAILCIAIDVTNRDTFRYAPCYRFFEEKGNNFQYMVSKTMCDFGHDMSKKNLDCRWAERRVGWFNATPKNEYDMKQ